jgi:hypothetical protein
MSNKRLVNWFTREGLSTRLLRLIAKGPRICRNVFDFSGVSREFRVTAQQMERCFD